MDIKRIAIDRLTLRQFKGVTDFVLDLGGRSGAVYGDNATGKTTLADAWRWLWTGQDSSQRADFNIKTLNTNGDEIHHLTHEVLAELRIDDRDQEFRRGYTEDWTQHRGSARKERTGHTTAYHIDGVPMKAQEFANAVAGVLASPDSAARTGGLVEAINLLSDPAYFAETLHWTRRRELLLEISGDVELREVIAAKPVLAELEALLKDRSADEHRKVINARRTLINKELGSVLPARVDEATRSLPEAEGDSKAITATALALRGERAKHQEEIASLRSGESLVELRSKIQATEAMIAARSTAVREEKTGEVQAAEAAALESASAANSARIAHDKAKTDLGVAQRNLNDLVKQLGEIQATREVKLANEFAHEDQTLCPTCAQSIPEADVAKIRAQAEGDFNAAKANRLAHLDVQVAGCMLRIDDARLLAESRVTEAATAGAALVDATAIAETEREAATAAAKAVPDPEADDEYQSLVGERTTLEEALVGLETSTALSVAVEGAAVVALDAKIEAIEAQLATHRERARIGARIEDLKETEKALAVEFERLEHELWLLDEYTRTRVRMVTELINDKFEVARFKLFKTLGHGGIEEVCEITVNGVPWRDLNNGARIQVGLDAIRTLQSHFALALPVFIDQAESVTELPEMDCQVIRLVVNKDCADLQVEAEVGDGARSSVIVK